MSTLHHREHLSESFEPTEDELKIIFQAREKQAAKMRAEAYWAKVKEDGPNFEKWTPEILLDTIQGVCDEDGKPLEIDETNRKPIELLMQYFTRDPQFEQDGRSLKKGLVLYGGVGVGKTHIMRLLQHSNQYQLYRMVDCSDIAADFMKKDGGEQSLEKYFGDVKVQHRDVYGREWIGYCFDDFGVESEGRYFGNSVNVMERIIEVRYRSKMPITTHLITNLNAAQMRERYGQRTADRMREMFNLIEFPATAQSKRK